MKEIICRHCKTKIPVNDANRAVPILKCPNCKYPNANRSIPEDDAKNAGQDDIRLEKDSVNSNRPLDDSASTKRIIPGWLVVHDQQAPTQTYPLKLGRQVIGRNDPDVKPDIPIETKDDTMSRMHCVLEVELKSTGSYKFLLSDRKLVGINPEKMSMNGTYWNANAKPLSPHDTIVLNDGDCVQLGMTTVVLKTSKTVFDQDSATKAVKNKDYPPTVVIKRLDKPI